jgi:ABC-2 type transport system permease protein
VVTGGELQSVYVSWKRIMIRFSRSKGRILGTMLQPVIFLLAFGIGLRGGNSLDFILPGIMAMAVIMSSSMAGISVMWDREFGFLKEILVAPVSRASAVVGRSLGAITTAMIQAVWIGGLGVLLGAKINPAGIIPGLVFLILTSAVSVGIGIAFASRMTDPESFHVIQNLVIMPLTFLSGAFIDVSNAPGWLATVAKANPFTYGIDGLRHVLTSGGAMGAGLDLLVISVSAVILTLISIRCFEKIRI